METDNKTIPADTITKIDFLIRAVKDGKFDTIIKKCEFKDKLSGEFDEPLYIRHLLDRIDKLERECNNYMYRISTLESEKCSMEGKLTTVENDMRSVAIAIQYLFNPNPLSKTYDLDTIDGFLNSKGIPRY